MDPALMQQILGTSQLGEQQQSTGNELADLIARRRAYNADQPTTGLGALFGRISDMIMGRNENDLRSRQLDLAKQITQRRQSYAEALAGNPMGPATPPGMPSDNPPRIPPSLEDQGQLATMGELSGDPIMSKVGQGALARAQQAPKLALETQQAQKAMQENQAMESPEAGSLLRGLAGKYGAQVPPNTPSAVLRALMPTLEKGYAAGEGKFTTTPTGQIYDTRTGKMAGGGAAGGATIPSDMLDSLAHQFAQTGEMPQLRMGRAGIAIYPQILKRAAELHPELDLAGARAQNKADTGSLGNQQKILDNAEGWERTGKANLNVLLGVAQKLQDTGSPWLNRPVRAFMDKGAGDPNQAAFRAAHATVVNEYAKILSGAQGSGAVTEGARHEAESMLPLDATWEQLNAAAKVLDTDAGNRIGAARQQVTQIRGRLSGKSAGPAAAAPADTVDVISPEGKAGKIPAANLDAALKRGFKRAGP